MTEIDSCNQNLCDFSPIEPLSRKESSYPDAIGAWIAEMDYPVAPAILDVVRRNVDASLLSYVDAPIRKRALEATAAWLEHRFGYAPPKGSLFLVADIIAGYESVLRVLAREDAPVIVPTPAYHLLLHTPQYFGRKLIELPCAVSATGRYLIDYEGLDAVLEPGAVFALTNPYNPVGQVFTRSELGRLAEIIDAHNALVFADEVHSPLILDPRVRHIPYASVSQAAAEHSVTAISASKSFNITGLKCAQLIIPGERLRKAWKPYAFFYGDGVSRLGLYAAATAYADPHCTRWLDETLGRIRGNLAFAREYFAEHNPHVVLSQHQATYLLWMDLRWWDLGARPADYLLKHARVALNDGEDFGSPGFVRLNMALEPGRFEEAVRRISAALDTAERREESTVNGHGGETDE
ncbi:MAG: aminotransferase class I/II-fold pyridoxal phosphate-dependent enzyme [Coriobacteriales bacterium]|jgi:cystathionine beta-lyase|nr:aminotransferase class I/II-fold pyridoxal phosphate-dependent enzyme [Coriobacteriales bacterium]